MEHSPEHRRRRRRRSSGAGLVIALIFGFLAGMFVPRIYTEASEGNIHTFQDLITVVTGADSLLRFTQRQVPYELEVNYDDIVLDEARQEKKLIILSQNATVPHEIKKAGLFGWSIYAQKKYVVLHGVGTYSVDLGQISSKDIVIHRDSKTIDLYIPEPELSVEYLPENTEFFDSQNGLLRFGEMELTPEMNAELETMGKEKIRQNFESDEKALATARKFAALSVKELFETVLNNKVDAAIKMADDDLAVPAYYDINVLVGEKAPAEESTEDDASTASLTRSMPEASLQTGGETLPAELKEETES